MQLFYEYNKDLMQIEFLMVNKKEGLTTKYSHISKDISMESLPKLVNWINQCLEDKTEDKKSNISSPTILKYSKAERYDG